MIENRAPSTLAERLGFSPTDKILIVKADDAGLSHAENQATFDALERGLVASASVMVVCPWFPEVAAYAREHPAMDFGVHLTHTSEMDGYRWHPLASRSEAPGLFDPEGYLWARPEQVSMHASPEEVEREARLQIETALAAGLDVTHLDSHMATLHLDVRFHAVYRRLAVEFNLPIRMLSHDLLAKHQLSRLRTDLKEDGVVCPDYFVYGDKQSRDPIDVYWRKVLTNLRPGVTELAIHPAVPSEEMRRMTRCTSRPFAWEARALEHQLFARDATIRALLEEHAVKFIGYRALRQLQRSEHNPA